MLPRIRQGIRVAGFPVLLEPSGLVRAEPGQFKGTGNISGRRPLPAVRDGRHRGHRPPVQRDLHADSVLNPLDNSPNFLFELSNAHLIHEGSVLPQ